MKNLVECLKTKLGQNNYLSLTISDFEIFLILKIRVYTNSLAFVYWGKSPETLKLGSNYHGLLKFTSKTVWNLGEQLITPQTRLICEFAHRNKNMYETSALDSEQKIDELTHCPPSIQNSPSWYPKTSTLKWLFQLNDSKSLHKNLGVSPFNHPFPKKWLVLGVPNTSSTPVGFFR